MRPKEHRCERPCRYRGNGWPDASTNGCDYILITKHSRVKAAMELCGTQELTKEVRELLDPRHCPFFDPRPRGKRRTNPVTWEEQNV